MSDGEEEGKQQQEEQQEEQEEEQEEEEEEELQNNNRVDIQLTDLLDLEEEEDGAAEEEEAAGGRDESHCLFPCRELTADEIRAADQVMERRDLDAVLFTKYSIPITVRDLHRAAQPGTWGAGADDTRYYLNDELVNYWFKMLNTKLDERAFAGTREKNVCLLSSYFLSKLQENMQQCPSTARHGRVLQLAARIKNKARTSLLS